jgi:hypothetical protein
MKKVKQLVFNISKDENEIVPTVKDIVDIVPTGTV